MNVELITIGSELLLGFTVDTNAAVLGQELAAHGVRIVRRTSIPDTPEAIREAVSDAVHRTGAVITTGGLGPTRDDMTKGVVAELFGRPVVFQQDLWERLLERYRRVGRTPVESNRTQAEIPEGATVLPNQWGSAPGIWLEGQLQDGTSGLVIMLPGVPSEMTNLLRAEVLPRLDPRSGGLVVRSRTLRTTGVSESLVAERLGDVELDVRPLTLAYLPNVSGVDLRLTAWDIEPSAADSDLERGAERVRRQIADAIYGEGEDDIASLVLERARQAGRRISVAESCTGGLVGARLTEIPGSSDVLEGGVVCYSYESKTALLDVPADLIKEHGAVSEQVARAMAEGALKRLGGDLSVAITGIAGPGGGTPDKPVGTVWFATAMEGDVRSSRNIFMGSRFEVRARAAQRALFLLWKRLEEGGRG